MARSTGLVKWFNARRGYGFVKVDGSDEELFVHQSSINSDGFRSLKEGEKIEFTVATGSVAGGSGGVSCYNCGKAGHFSRNCPSERVRSAGAGVCYNCGQPGHLARECGRESNGGRSGGGECYNCGEKGHFARDCGIEKVRASNNDGCYNCGESGHFARDCSRQGKGGGSHGGGKSGGACFRCGDPDHRQRDCPN